MSQDMKRQIDDLTARTVRYEADVRALFESMDDVKNILRRVALTTARTAGDLAQLKTYVHANLVTKKEFDTRMDGFAGRIDDFRLHMAQQKERLDDLERKPKHS